MVTGETAIERRSESWKRQQFSPMPRIESLTKPSPSSSGATPVTRLCLLYTSTVMNLSAEAIGELALEQQNALYELTDLSSLEDAFMELTEGAVEYRAS